MTEVIKPAGYPVMNCLHNKIPTDLLCTDPVALTDELEFALSIRRQYIGDVNKNPYMNDMVRAFRLLKGQKTYIEVGSRDKGCVAYASYLLDEEATIIDIDLINDVEAEKKIRASLPVNQKYHMVEGNSIAPETIQSVKSILGESKADVIFLDSNHMYYHFLNEFDLYYSLLRPGGYILVHDIYFEGTAEQKGKSQALQFIDRHFDVFSIYCNDQITPYFPLQKNSASWGGVGIIKKA